MSSQEANIDDNICLWKAKKSYRLFIVEVKLKSDVDSSLLDTFERGLRLSDEVLRHILTWATQTVRDIP